MARHRGGGRVSGLELFEVTNMGTTGKVVAVVIGGIVVYYVYQAYTTPAATASATPATPATPAAPASGSFSAWLASLQTPAPAPAAPAPAPAASAQTLDSIYFSLIAAVANDTNFTGSGSGLTGSPDHWNVYLTQLVPGVNLNLDTLFGPSPRANVTAAAFWSVVAPQLQSQLGLSGLGMFGGLGQLIRPVR